LEASKRSVSKSTKHIKIEPKVSTI
jgi:hypothetical protein